jgi:hypothetical protein
MIRLLILIALLTLIAYIGIFGIKYAVVLRPLYSPVLSTTCPYPPAKNRKYNSMVGIINISASIVDKIIHSHSIAKIVQQIDGRNMKRLFIFVW